ncbi:MAG: MFS transporter, partial [Planctomycetota bacterium]
MTTHHAPYPEAATMAPAPADVPEAGVSAPGRRAATVVVGHTFVDVLSFVVIPLMPLLKASLTLSDAEIAILLATGSVCSGAIQPAVAWLCDRFHTRVFGTIGFAVALLAVASIGFAESFWALLAIQVIGPAGIGAFHPPAAAAV